MLVPTKDNVTLEKQWDLVLPDWSQKNIIYATQVIWLPADKPSASTCQFPLRFEVGYPSQGLEISQAVFGGKCRTVHQEQTEKRSYVRPVPAFWSSSKATPAVMHRPLFSSSNTKHNQSRNNGGPNNPLLTMPCHGE